MRGESYFRVDVTNAGEIRRVLAKARPDVVFHLAATTADRMGDPTELLRATLAGVSAVCDAMLALSHPVRLVLAGSSAEYGTGPRPGERVAEDAPCRPVTGYGRAKLAAERHAIARFSEASLDVVAVRAFNHIGPGEPSTTVAGAIARRVLSVARGNAPRLQVADPSSVRDFTDVRDIARGYAAIAETGVSGRVYNLCSGTGRSVAEILDMLLAGAGLDRGVVELLPDTVGGVRSQVGSPELVRRDVGWAPEISLDRSITDLLASLREAVDVA
jgi:GDP-4-dehydro-6-deoxy-D-mannose reductase